VQEADYKTFQQMGSGKAILDKHLVDIINPFNDLWRKNDVEWQDGLL